MHASVLQIFAEFEPLLAWNALPFFPEYTDHGPTHIAGVLETVARIVPSASRTRMTPEDVGVLMLSVLWHDCGMHFSEDNFLALIDHRPDRDVDSGISRAFADRPWHLLWSEFLFEARRWDGKMLRRLFGSTDPIRRPPTRKDQLTLLDRKLIGEFLRRHHARLAHEIAVAGFPMPEGGRAMCNNLDDWMQDLSGLIARSHGMPIRSCLEPLSKYHAREYKGVHAVYLMSLLRVADYLQIQSSRAPRQRREVSILKSPLSSQEWRTHSNIASVTFEDDDPEAMYITVEPHSVAEFLKLQYLLQSLQAELDTSWAVLGEVYGRFANLRHFGLSVRRIKSNLDDPESFSRSVRYFPRHARITASGSELLRLLIDPLYGGNCHLALRELIQNAVDACNERAALHASRGNASGTMAQALPIEISLTKDETGATVLTVSDAGVGMTPDTICNYYLRVGASFRSSDDWRSLHAHDGARTVMRSGRFGVGAVAPFLLGEELSITTRHFSVEQDNGTAFQVRMDSDIVELRRASRPTGTTISVKLNKATEDALLDWNRHMPTEAFGSFPDGIYLLNSPTLAIKIFGARLSVGERWPDFQSRLPIEWHSFTTSDYPEVHWTYQPSCSYTQSPGALVVNGLAVSRNYKDVGGFDAQAWDVDTERIGLITPTLSVFDADARFPLNLTRSAIAARRLPFQTELIREIAGDLVAWMVADPNTESVSPERGRPRISYPGLNERVEYLLTSRGYTISSPWTQAAVRLKTQEPRGFFILDDTDFAEIQHAAKYGGGLIFGTFATLLPVPFIPYDPDERCHVLRTVYSTLRDRIEHYRLLQTARDHG